MLLPPPGAVKVCGLTNRADAEAAAAAGADYLGLIFAPSPRRVEAGDVEEWVAEVRAAHPAPRWVGVFLPGDAASVRAVADRLALDVLQLHGGAVGEGIYGLGRPVWAALRLRGPGDGSPAAEPRAHALLVDTFDPLRAGGTGRSFPWEWVSGWGRQRRIIVSGGLRPDNVAAAIDAVRPYAVDASSGLESSPGRKDPELLRAFVRRAKAAFASIADANSNRETHRRDE